MNVALHGYSDGEKVEYALELATAKSEPLVVFSVASLADPATSASMVTAPPGVGWYPDEYTLVRSEMADPSSGDRAHPPTASAVAIASLAPKRVT